MISRDKQNKSQRKSDTKRRSALALNNRKNMISSSGISGLEQLSDAVQAVYCREVYEIG